MSEYEGLRPFLLMDFWREGEAWNLLAGIKEDAEHPNSYSDPGLVVLATGEELEKWDDFGERRLTPEYADASKRIETIRDIWHGSAHDSAEAKGGFNTARQYRKNYCIGWALRKQIEIPWLDWAIKNKYLPENIGQTDRPPPAPKEESEREKNNRLKLIGCLLELLIRTGKKRTFASQSQLIGHLLENYKGDANDGLSKTTLDRVFAEANKAKGN